MKQSRTQVLTLICISRCIIFPVQRDINYLNVDCNSCQEVTFSGLFYLYFQIPYSMARKWPWEGKLALIKSQPKMSYTYALDWQWLLIVFWVMIRASKYMVLGPLSCGTTLEERPTDWRQWSYCLPQRYIAFNERLRKQHAIQCGVSTLDIILLHVYSFKMKSAHPEAVNSKLWSLKWNFYKWE